MLKRSSKLFLVALMLVAALMMFGCGSDGSDGAQGPPGPAGPAGPEGPASPAIPATAVEPETCIICHGDVDQTEHQSIYNEYTDASTLALTINGVTSVAGTEAGTFDATVTFTVMQNGAPYTDVDGLPSLQQKSFYAVAYDSTTSTFDQSVSFSGIDTNGDGRSDVNFVSTGNPGQFEAYAIGAQYDPAAFTDGQLYGYVAKGKLETEDLGESSHVTLYNDVANAALTLGAGNAATYASPANVSGCKKCHGDPYYKHGYRAAQVTGLGDFAACKACHYDTRNGGHADWQILVTDPLRFAERFLWSKDNPDLNVDRDNPDLALTDTEKAQYAYKAKVMNDVHMSHSMEFGYPQSMSNCATCHEGNLDIIQAAENFTAETCKSCHPVTSTVAEGDNEINSHAAPSLQQLWIDDGVESFHDITKTCNACHIVGGAAGEGVPLFSELMPGYNPMIYADNNGTKYSQIFKAKIDDAAYADNILTINFHVEEDAAVENTSAFSLTDIVPNLLVGLYGYDTKDFIVSPHSSDENRKRLLEGDISEDLDNPRFTIESAPGDGTFVVKVDLSRWAGMIDSLQIKRAEIAVRPALRNPDAPFGVDRDGNPNPYAIDAVSRTFDFTKPGFDDTFFGGNNVNSITDVKSCNSCHDALGTTFHTADRGGDVTVCRLCHWSGSGGSHLEMQSRAIDSYVHAIHTFQDFDIGDIDFTDPVQEAAYDVHVEHFFPRFTEKACEACHNADKYMVPDQSKSLSAVLSASDTVEGRSLTVPSYVTGPGYRSCGGCHRAEEIKEGEFGELISLNQHASDMGYLVKAGDNSDAQLSTWDEVVKTIQAFFQ